MSPDGTLAQSFHPQRAVEGHGSQEDTADMLAEAAVTLPLWLVEELVGRTLVWKVGMLDVILHDVGGLIASERGLHIEK
jgi:hypothetical protein